MLPSSEFLASGHSSRFFDRELSWIALNRRLLYEVSRSAEPVLGRLVKLSQAATALDEYFMVRVPILKGAQGLETDVMSSDPLPFQRMQAYLQALVARQQAYFANNLKPALAHQGVHILEYGDLTDMQQRQCQRRFEEDVLHVLPALTTTDPEVTPDFSNLSLNLAVELATPEGEQWAWIKLPKVIPRFMVLPGLPPTQDWIAVPMEQVIAAHLPLLFSDYPIRGCFPFRVTRSADLGLLDSETVNLMDMIQESLLQRQQQGQAVRLEVLQSMPLAVRSRLLAHLDLTPQDLYCLTGLPGLGDLAELARLPRPDLQPPLWQPVLPVSLRPPEQSYRLSFATVLQAPADNLFTAIAAHDLLLHFPYHSFSDTVEQFVAQAAVDPAVLTLKMTLYRTAIDAPIVRSLMAAAKAGKQVVVLVELTTPLDEAINIHWAKRLEKAGAHVVYGVLGLRTHTNLVLVVRREAKRLRQYAYLGTGDYVPDRPQPYEDLGLLTHAPAICADLNHLFNFLTGYSRAVPYSTLMVAPGQLKTQLQSVIAREAHHAQNGKPARLIVKLNLLADPDMIETLYAAAEAGVQIDLIVRGICRLRPGVKGLSDRIRVTSILGEPIEHSRVVYCLNDQQPAAWIGTADWTPRGLNERIEVMVPLPATLVVAAHTLLETLLADTQNSWVLQPDGRYLKRHPPANEPPWCAHDHFKQQVKAGKNRRK